MSPLPLPPDLDLHAATPPLEGVVVRGEPEVDLVALVGPSAVLDPAKAVAWNVNHGSERQHPRVGRDGSVSGLCAAGGDADLLGFAHIRPGTVHRPSQPEEGALPAAALAAVAVSGGLKHHDPRLLVARRLNTAGMAPGDPQQGWHQHSRGDETAKGLDSDVLLTHVAAT